MIIPKLKGDWAMLSDQVPRQKERGRVMHDRLRELRAPTVQINSLWRTQRPLWWSQGGTKNLPQLFSIWRPHECQEMNWGFLNSRYRNDTSKAKPVSPVFIKTYQVKPGRCHATTKLTEKLGWRTTSSAVGHLPQLYGSRLKPQKFA